jgi:S-adenosylmethionine:tRNA ribosyltransferase-isomerase
LPPYIKQDDSLAAEYQTVYAKPEGSKAAPTAGLHFTPELLSNIKSTHQVAEVTLHVGLGTFAPLSEEQLKLGKLHKEWYEIDALNSRIIREATHITAVGTTSTRTLESVNEWRDSSISGWTDILISPGYEFNKVDSLITNFHLPGTSLLLLVEAFVGSRSELQRIYNHAVSNKYRFYSFGDAMLVI